jgi:hypothetical protein
MHVEILLGVSLWEHWGVLGSIILCNSAETQQIWVLSGLFNVHKWEELNEPLSIAIAAPPDESVMIYCWIMHGRAESDTTSHPPHQSACS